MRPSDDQLRARLASLVSEEVEAGEWQTYWLSYADDKRSHGVVCVRAPGPMAASVRVSLLGIRLPGSVQIWPVGDTVREEDLDRVLTKHYIENEMRAKGEV